MSLTYAAAMEWLERDQLEVTARRELRLLSSTTQTGVENALRDAQPADVAETFARLERVNPQVDLVWFDQAGVEVAASEGGGAGATELRLLLRQAVSEGGQAFSIIARGDRYVALQILPLRQDDVHVSGYLGVALPLDEAEAELLRIRQISLVGIVLGVVASLLLMAVLGRAYVLAPLGEVRAGLRRLRGEAPFVRLDPLRRDEVGMLQEEVNTLAEALQRAEAKLREEMEARRLFQAALQRRERLAAVGQVAATVAHEIGSPLQILLGQVQRLRERLGDRPEVSPQLEALEAQLERIQRTMQQTLGLTRPRPAARRWLAPESPLLAMADLFREEARRVGVELEVALEAALPSVEADGDQLQQILFNLLSNALTWTPQGGRVTLRARRGEAEDLLGRSQPSLVLEVADTGVGMSEEVRRRSLEPFFTLREERGGTGLGLAIVKALVREHGGTLEVESAPGEGSTFRVWLPLQRRG